jgi:hypothetical protein
LLLAHRLLAVIHDTPLVMCRTVLEEFNFCNSTALGSSALGVHDRGLLAWRRIGKR